MRLLVRAALIVASFAVAAGGEARAGGAAEPIAEAQYVRIGGIDQWVTVRGRDASKPLLLLVHGGPADVQSPLVDTYAPYEREFVLVQWDQRGAGKTFARYGRGTPEVSLERTVADGIELAEHLRARFSGQDIILLGHSWGSVIAAGMAQQRPDLFAAYVGTGQVASWAASARWQFDFLLERARAENDRAAVAELEAIGRPDPADLAQYFRFTRTLRQHMNASDAAWLSGLAARAIAQGQSQADIEVIVEGMEFSGAALIETQARIDLTASAGAFAAPVCIIQGRHDLFTPTEPAERYFEQISAPRKRFFVIEGGGHFVMATHQSEFIADLEACLRASAA